MTRKHFEAMAAITAKISNDQTRSFVAHAQADYFATVNPLFDRQKFLTACGLGGKVTP
jgi:hypothetical protein